MIKTIWSLLMVLIIGSQLLGQSRFFTQNWVKYEGRININKAELFCELWGGHPNTSNKRFQINGGKSYSVPSDRPLVHLICCSEMPVPFWSRDNQLRKAVFKLPFASAEIEQADLYVRIWDGGEGSIKEPFKLNGIPYKTTTGNAPHDLICSINYLALKIY